MTVSTTLPLLIAQTTVAQHTQAAAQSGAEAQHTLAAQQAVEQQKRMQRQIQQAEAQQGATAVRDDEGGNDSGQPQHHARERDEHSQEDTQEKANPWSGHILDMKI